MSLIELKAINKTYGEGHAATPVLHDVNLAIAKGEFVAIMGPSGSGKSTLMNIIGLLDRASSGSYRFANREVETLKDGILAKLRRRSIGFIFQSFNLLPRLSAADNVALPMVYNRLPKLSRQKRVTQLLKLVGLSDRSTFRPTQLSGGEIQRVAIARALANKPSLILADEPTGNLDSTNGRNVMQILANLNQQGNTVVVITHDPAIAKFAKRIIHIKDGKIQRGKP
ncbi:ABC transporter ATP-binding protein [Candidatus Microgenomates bacterium]|nr:ABC transporter ATP-binding protein [Candidatus Microgenomates bacterium]